MTNASVACPDDAVTFTCTVTGTSIQWMVVGPPGSSISTVTVLVRTTAMIDDPLIVGSDPRFMFESVRIAANDGDLRSTLTTVSNISSLGGSMVTCVEQEQGPLTIQLAGIKLLDVKWLLYHTMSYSSHLCQALQ